MSEEGKVRLWIWGGFMSVLLLLATVGAVSYVSFEGTVDKFSESGRVGQSTVRVLLADRDMASVRMASRRYLVTGAERLLKAYQERKDSAIKGLNDARALIKSADQLQGIQRVLELLGSFDSRFDQSVALYKKKVALLKEASEFGSKSRIALDEFARANHAEAAVMQPLQTLMRSRLDMAEVTAEFNEETARHAAELARTYSAELKEMTAGQPAERRAKLAELATLAEGFTTALESTMAVSLDLYKLTEQAMDTIGKEIYTTSLALRDLQVKRQTALEEAAGNYVLNAKITIGTLTLIAIGIAILCAILISAVVSRPIAAMAVAARVAEEIGELIKMAAHDGDFRNRAPTEGRTGFVATISDAVNRLFDSMCEAFTGISRDANTVALAASDCSSAVLEVNAGAAEQARSLEPVREAIRTSAEALTKVSGNAKTASSAAEQATALVNRGQVAIVGMTDLMETMARNGREIALATQALAQIATKTDILATNAAIEAAGLGGDQGRRFAVIGQQIGNLSELSSSFSTKIAQLVETANRDLQTGLQAASGARQIIEDIQRQVADTDGMIHQIAEAMMSQQSAIIEIDATANSLAEIGEHNVESGEQISRRLVQLRDLSDATKEAVGKFKIERAGEARAPRPAA